MELDRSRDVAFLIQIGVFVDLGDDEIGVAQVLGEPAVVTRTAFAYPFSVMQNLPR